MKQNNQFKKSKVYKIVVACIVLLYFGYQVYAGVFGETVEEAGSENIQETSYAEAWDIEGTLEYVEADVENVSEYAEEGVRDTGINSADIENVPEYAEEGIRDTGINSADVENVSEYAEEGVSNTGINNADIENGLEQQDTEVASSNIEYVFRNEGLFESHYEKHGIEMGFSSKEEYLAAANAVLNNPATLHKIEAEDGDDVYFLEETNEFVVVSTDGYIRTYFCPSDGIEYFNRQ